MFKKIVFLFSIGIIVTLSKSFGQSGNYLVLDGTNSYMRVANSSTINIPSGNSFTLTCWANLSNASTSKRIISKRLGGSNSAYKLITSGSTQYGVNLSDQSEGVEDEYNLFAFFRTKYKKM